MNKKGLFQWLYTILGIILLVVVLIFLIKFTGSEYVNIKAYQKFCEERPEFCYCNFYQCEYRFESNKRCINGYCYDLESSKNLKELCDLAEYLEDKAMLFKAECN